MTRLFALFAFAALTYCGCRSHSGVSEWPDAVRRIHNSAIVVDGHNDLAWRIREFHDSSFDKIDLTRPQPDLHTDIDRLRRGGVGAQFWSAYVPVSTMADGAVLARTDRSHSAHGGSLSECLRDGTNGR